jgi:energy-coupling factor transporter ATP-binding protein EcfA2
MLYSISQISKMPLAQGNGFFLVVIGPDGSGKTTISNEIASFWEGSFHQKPLYIHGDFGFLPRLKYLRQLWAKLRGREPAVDIDYTAKHAGAEASPHSLLKSLTYLSYYYWGFLFGHFKIFLTKSSGKLVVADRYFYDYFFQRGNMKMS